MILLLTCGDDPSADLVAAHLTARRVPFARFDDADFPAQAKLSVSYNPTKGLTYKLTTSTSTIDLSDIQVAWDHRPGTPQPDPALSSMSRRFSSRESGEFIDDVWRSLDCTWFPAHKDVVLRAQHKASQLARAQAIGFEVPPTLITNNPAEFLAFRRRYSGPIISKVFHNSIQYPANDPAEPHAFTCMTNVVSNRDLGYISAIRHSPVIFQAYVPKQLELRVTVVGSQVLTAAIHSQRTHRTTHDWRRADLLHTRYAPFDLPREIESLCLRLVQDLGLHFGAIDLILTPDNRYVFLEINPSGQWRWVEKMSGLPISSAIADFLISANQPALTTA